MDFKDLKTRFFGFKKSSVYEYVSELERDFNARYLKQKEESDQQIAALSKKAEELNRVVVRLETEKSSYYSTLNDINGQLDHLKLEINNLQGQITTESKKNYMIETDGDEEDLTELLEDDDVELLNNDEEDEEEKMQYKDH